MMRNITATIQESIKVNTLLNDVTRKCWSVCMNNYHPKPTLSKQEKECLSNCAIKWIDTTEIIYNTTRHNLAKATTNHL